MFGVGNIVNIFHAKLQCLSSFGLVSRAYRIYVKKSWLSFFFFFAFNSVDPQRRHQSSVCRLACHLCTLESLPLLFVGAFLCLLFIFFFYNRGVMLIPSIIANNKPITELHKKKRTQRIFLLFV